MEMLKKYLDKFLFLGGTFSLILYCTTVYGQLDHNLSAKYIDVTKDINDVDSIFEVNFTKLYSMVNVEEEVEIHDHNVLEFVSVVSMMSGIDFIIHNCYTPTKIEMSDIGNIHYWYIRNKRNIKIDTLKRFYVATRVWCFESYNELVSYFDSLDSCIIWDDEFVKWLKIKKKGNGSERGQKKITGTVH